MATRVVMNPAKLAEVLRGPNGPVVREMMKAGEVVKDEARRIVRVHKPVGGQRRKRRPGTLRDSIVKRVRPDGVVEVGSDDDIAMIEEKGSHPHPISPTNAPRLAFYSTKHGRVIVLKAGRSVHHRGTKGSKYLTRALEVIRRRY